ncbi:hypothetical protein [Sphingomonas sp. 3-13AW]|uniref:hypothetical protein n=1 Tax=Sphingomonas sp. 3-13AW TaxID=3050450 RepID=UPI003BB4FA12
MAILADPEMVALFARNGVLVKTAPGPGRDMIRVPASEAGHAFSWLEDDATAALVSGIQPTSLAIQPTSAPTPLYTSPVILAWGPAADALSRAGIVQGTGRWRTLDATTLMESAAASKRWSEVVPEDGWTSARPLQIRAADLRRSGTTTMFLAVAALAANGGRDILSSVQANLIADQIAPLFQLGRQPVTSQEAINEFVSFGISRTPLLLVGEADAIQLLNRVDAPADLVVLYPRETVVTPQTFVPHTPMGRRVGKILDGAEARKIALRHGFRVAGSDKVPGRWADGAERPPSHFQTILEMPEGRIIETMIARIAAKNRARETAVQPPAMRWKSSTAPPAIILDPNGDLPPVRPVIDPQKDARRQQIEVQNYLRRLEGYRTRQAASAAGNNGQ